VDPSVEAGQVKKLSQMKESRDNIRVGVTLDEIRHAAQGNDNLIPRILDAVHAYATEGEICGVLRDVYGEYKENVVL
jgi:methylmalonyl-CoA mutase N-terminal domain/subunit